MKFSPLALVSMPPLWAWSSGFFLTPLATALGSSNPALAASAWQAVVFVTSATVAVQILSKAAGHTEPTPAREMTSRELGAALRAGREQERQLAEAQREYASQVSNGSQAVKIGKRKYHFPVGIEVEHLLALAEVVGQGLPPTDRALVPPFERGDGKTYQVFRDWMVYHAGEKPGALAQFRSRKMDWDLTPLGMVMLYEWLKSYYPLPTQTPADVKKTLVALNKAKRARTSKGNR